MKRKGFTLIELMIVLIIIGILATVGIVQYQSAVEKARGAEAKSVLNHLRQKCAALYYEGGIDACTGNNAVNLSIGDTSSGAEVPGPTQCRPSHYFVYRVVPVGVDGANFTATRCVANGKNPQYRSVAGGQPRLWITCNYSNATSCNTMQASHPGVY